MIRVIVAAPGESFHDACQHTALLSANDAASVARLLPTADLDETATGAVRRALSELKETDADIVIVAGAGLYRIYPRPADVVALEASAPGPVPWTKFKDASILVAGMVPELASLVEALRFLGYQAHRVEALGGPLLAAALAEHVPLVTLMGLAPDQALDNEGVAMCRAKGSAVALLGTAAERDGADAALPLPIVMGRLGELLDPLVRVAQERRTQRPPVGG